MDASSKLLASQPYELHLTSAPPLNGTLTRITGCPIAHMKNSLTAGQLGPVLLQDIPLIEKLQHFDRENIPPRKVHAPGDGAYGHLIITKDITAFSRAKVFSKIGMKTPCIARLSGTFTEKGDPQTYRDIRGFALKFYTEEGNWDLMTINVPVFNCRDMQVGPDTVHAFKRDPVTDFYSQTQRWDFVAHHPEGLYNALMFHSDVGGTPMSFRTMNGFGCNTYSFINSKNERFWVKFHLTSKQGELGLDEQTAIMIAGEDPHFLFRDLREAIERRDFPEWTLSVQIMSEEEGYKKPFTFDCTKIWKVEDYPLIEIGTIQLNRNPIDAFAEVEQVAFSPANVVPGISFSPDKLLQGRLFVYSDTQLHRLGPNHNQIWINRPHGVEPNTIYVGGQHRVEIKDKFPHYFPSLYGKYAPDEKYLEPPMRTGEVAMNFDPPGDATYEDFYLQPKEYLAAMSKQARDNLCKNIATSFVLTDPRVVSLMLAHFEKVDPEFARKVQEETQAKKTNLTQNQQKIVELRKMLSAVGQSTGKH